MPDFRLTDAEAAALALNIAAGEPGSAGADATALRTLMREQPVVRDTTVARRIRVALRCDACHEGTAAQAAPPLPRAAEGLQRDWLRTFLQSPHTVRPLGWRPGSATRMPGFALSATELDSLLAWLAPDTSPSIAIEPISDRLRDNTLTLMRDRWSCMGCHAWNGEGGRIGPDLAETGSRLTTRRIRAMLEDPSTTVPGTIMPKALLQPREVDRIVAVLTHARGAGHGDPVSPLDAETFDPATGEDAAGIYDRTCAVCHGRDGRGDGVHAMMLDAPPAVHADSAAMSARPDDTLYDGIAAGGRILGGSDDMPAFGGSLPPETIRALVAHIRTLCDCTGPQWSRDDGVRR